MSARASIAIAFLLHAAASATWASRLPALKSQAELTDGELGIALFGMAVGLVGGTRAAGSLVDRYGSRPLVRASVALVCATIVLPGLATDLGGLTAAFVALGFASGVLDVAMNAQGVAVERHLGRPVLSGLHGLWSVGLGVGAGIGALFAAAGSEPLVHFVVVGAVLALISLFTLRHLLRTASPDARSAGETAGDSPVGVWSAIVLALGAICFCSFVGEGGTADWSAVYLRETLGASSAVAALGLGAFSVAMAASRFTADSLVMRLGPVRVVRAGGLLAAAGFGTAVVASAAPVAIAGFVLIGAGLGPIVPVAFSAAGHIGGTVSGRVLSRVVLIGYLGTVIGPLAIGGLASLTSLRIALCLPIGLALCATALAGWVDRDQAVRSGGRLVREAHVDTST
jgi:MFS family permease